MHWKYAWSFLLASAYTLLLPTLFQSEYFTSRPHFQLVFLCQLGSLLPWLHWAQRERLLGRFSSFALVGYVLIENLIGFAHYFNTYVSGSFFHSNLELLLLSIFAMIVCTAFSILAAWAIPGSMKKKYVVVLLISLGLTLPILAIPLSVYLVSLTRISSLMLWGLSQVLGYCFGMLGFSQIDSARATSTDGVS